MTDSHLKAPGAWHKWLLAFIWYDVIILIYAGLVAFYKEFSTKPPVADIEKLEKRTGQVVVITGGPRGLALGLIKRLVELDYTIIMGVRNIGDSEKRLAVFADENKPLSFYKIKFFPLDLNSLKSVRSFADSVKQETLRVDLLLCNAAIMYAPYELTEDGYESQFQVNYLSNFLLTEMLLDRLKQTALKKGAPCQIIYTSSLLYRYGKFNPAELEKPLVYTTKKFYFPSKLYPIMSMLHLQRVLEKDKANVNCYAVHPGLVPTDLWHSAGGSIAFWIGQTFKRFLRTLENAADTILWPVLCPTFLNLGGLYMESGKAIVISEQAANKDLQATLYRRSLELAGIEVPT